MLSKTLLSEPARLKPQFSHDFSDAAFSFCQAPIDSQPGRTGHLLRQYGKSATFLSWPKLMLHASALQ